MEVLVAFDIAPRIIDSVIVLDLDGGMVDAELAAEQCGCLYDVVVVLLYGLDVDTQRGLPVAEGPYVQIMHFLYVFYGFDGRPEVLDINVHRNPLH